jgi:hypothetical protein
VASDIARDFAGMNELWDAWVPDGCAPTRATVQSQLAAPDFAGRNHGDGAQLIFYSELRSRFMLRKRSLVDIRNLLERQLRKKWLSTWEALVPALNAEAPRCRIERIRRRTQSSKTGPCRG